MARPTNKNRFSDELKKEAVTKVLSGQMTIEEARKSLDATSYLVASWIGIHVEARVREGYRLMKPGQASEHEPTELTDTGVLPAGSFAVGRLSAKLTPQQRAIVEMYVNDLIGSVS